MISASALPRLMRCPGSAALPSANTTSEWSEAGTERHEDQEDRINAGDVPEEIRALVGDGVEVRAEVALAYDVSTGAARELGTGIARDYSGLGPYEIPGTCDALAILPDSVVVIDHKGWESVDAAERNVQVAFLALTAARAHRKNEATVAIVYLRGDRRVVDKAALDMFELDAFAGRVRAVHAAVGAQRQRRQRGELVDVAEGPHCKYCPAVAVCPAKVALLQRLISGQEADEMELMMPLDATSARNAYERWQAGRALLRRVERALYAFAAETPIPLGDGKFFGKYTKPGNEKLDGDVMYKVVREKHGPEVALQAVTLSATKTRLKDALKAANVAPVAAAERDVLAEVRARGGATREPTETVGEYEARLELVTKEAS